jgi:hypothetical protein
MARADELEHGERIRLPDPVDVVGVVTVEHVTTGLSWAKVYWRSKGARGMFKCLPHTDISVVP